MAGCGWFTDSEKTAAQLIIEESSDAGTDSFMPQVWRFEREKSLAVRRLGPAPDRARVLARLRGYKEPWQHELIEDDIIALEIDVLFDRRAARERKIAPVDSGNAAADLAYFDDPTARSCVRCTRIIRCRSAPHRGARGAMPLHASSMCSGASARRRR